MEKLKGKSEIIIIAVVALAIVIGIVIFNIVNKKEEFVYGIFEAVSPTENVLIENYKDFEKFLKKTGASGELKIDFKKYSVKERYNEEYFQNKKLAIIIVSEDSSRDYFHDVSDVIYNDSRTDVTIKYQFKTLGYAGTLSRTWQTCMVVELDNTVNNVNFVLDNSSIEEEK